MSRYLPFNLFIRQALLYPLVAPFLPGKADVKDGVKYAAGELEGEYECPPGGGIPWTGQTIVYQPGDDGDYQKGLTLDRPIVKGEGSNRFILHGDNTTEDLATGLIWITEPLIGIGAPFNVKMNWENAIINCEALVWAGHNDWRLPNIKESFSIMDFGILAARIDKYFFPLTRTVPYWTSTTRWNLATYAVMINYDTTAVTNSLKTGINYVRPVRGGLPV